MTLIKRNTDDITTILYSKLSDNAVEPVRKHALDAGADLSSSETYTLQAGQRHLFHTGISIALPDDSVGFIAPRSGLAAKHGLTVLNSPGIIDAGYRGELLINIYNSSDDEVLISAGDRIAQLIVVPFLKTEFELTESTSADDLLLDDNRGTNGIGSTGR